MISIVIPVRNNLDITRVCLDSIKRYTDDYELIIINEGSDEKTTKYLSKFCLDKHIYIENKIPLGWCKAINQGFKKAKGDYIVFSNNDTVITPHWAEKMLEHFKKDKNLGILGPISNGVAGYQHVDFNKEGINFQYADVVTFFFVMISRATLEKVGDLDERFGLGGQDDADYCIRARQNGFKVGIARDVFIYHYGSATFREIFKNDIPTSKEFAESRILMLRDKYRNINIDGVKKRIFIAVPNGGTIVPEIAINFMNWSHSSLFEMQVYMPKGIFPLDAARNHCVEKFLQSNCDYLLWIDDDIVPPLNTIERFLAADKDIIGAVCFAMKYENDLGFTYPVTLRYNEDRKYIAYYGKGVEEVDATGGACVMFRRKVYEAIEHPYAFQYYRNGTLALTCDFDIFQKAQKAGFKIYIDFDIVCDHIKETSFRGIQNTLVREQTNKLIK